jgi:hypothetical protein
MTAIAFAILLNALPFCDDDKNAPCCVVEWVGDGWRQRQVMRRIQHPNWGRVYEGVTEPRQCLSSDLRA